MEVQNTITSSSPIPPKPPDIHHLTNITPASTLSTSPAESQPSFREKLLAREQIIEIDMDLQENEDEPEITEAISSKSDLNCLTS